MASVIHYPQYATNAHDAPVTVIHSEEGARDVAKEKYLKSIDVKNLKLRKEFQLVLRYELTGEENHKAEACLKRIQAYLDFAFITKDGDNSGITTMSLIDALSYVKEGKDEVCPLETMCRSLVQKAAERGDIRFVKALYNSYKDRIVYEEEVQTALMYAAHNGHADVVQYLVPYEAGCRDCYGETALMYAVEGGHERCVEILLNTRDVGQINSDGKTALMLAIEKGCSEKIVRLLSAVECKK